LITKKRGKKMNIAVLLKQVPDTTAKITISDGKVDENSVSKWSMSPYDEYALESGLQLKEATGGDLIAITCGPERAKKMLTDAAAVGADTLVHIPDDGVSDSTHVQKLLAAAVKKFDSHVVLCGKQAADTNGGSTGPGVAELLDAACVTLVSEVNFSEGNFTTIRPSNSGTEKVIVDGLSVFAFDKGSSELRRPNVRGIMMAKKKPVESITSSDLGVNLDPSNVKMNSQNPPPEKPAGQKFEGAEYVNEVVSKLRNEANVI
jgi:electron transfer flavoprotein beta subunit